MSGRNAEFVKQWWTLNPDYEYAFFNDSHARRYVMARASPKEKQAYLYLLRGAQRADLFRMIWMKYEGGLRRPRHQAAQPSEKRDTAKGLGVHGQVLVL